MPDLSVVQPRWQPVRHTWPIITAACLGLAVAAASWWAVSSWEDRLAQAKLKDTAKDYASALQYGFDQYLGRLLAIRAFYDASNKVDEAEFTLFTGRVLGGYGDKMRVLWSPRVAREDRTIFEFKGQAAGRGGFFIWNWSRSGPRERAQPREEHFPILYLTHAGERVAPQLGMDLKTEPVRSGALDRARDSGSMATAQDILLHTPDGQERHGFFAALPVYRQGLPHDSLADRRRNLLGILGGEFDAERVIDAILAKTALPRDVDLYVFPAEPDGAAMPVYMRGASERETPVASKSEAELASVPHARAVVKAGDSSWNIAVVPTQFGPASFYRAWLVLAAVILVFGAVLTYMWASLRHTLRLEAANRKILDLAQTDLLTELPNRRAFMKRLTMAFTGSCRGAPRFAVLYLDIDDFKDVNDTLGHAMGDLLLKEVVGRIKLAMRPTDLVARFGGDEFAILMFDVTDPDTVGALAARIRATLAQPFVIENNRVRITSSIGIALFSSEASGPETMMMQADLALYGAKDEGRNCYRFHSPDLDREVRERVRVSDELTVALEHGDLELYYQPQVELASGRIIGVEALVRWNHKTRGLLTPAHFIPIAERTGAVLPLGRFVFDEACRQLSLWHIAGIAPQVMSVNVSGLQFKAASEIDRDVEASVTRWGIDPSSLELELTESVLMEATQRYTDRLENLRRLGTRIAIDDFGTGYSSLKYLTIYPVNRLKLAQEFVSEVTANYRNAAVVRASIRLAHELGVEVIAEGVETEAQVRFLIGAGCEQAQGYYYSRPVQAEQVTRLLRRGRIEPARGPGSLLATTAA
jgi:diguanylate cyclase (GGDEF)-like protein